MLVLILTFLGCGSVQGAEPIEVQASDWHGLEKRVLQLDVDGNLDEDEAPAASKEEIEAPGEGVSEGE